MKKTMRLIAMCIILFLTADYARPLAQALPDATLSSVQNDTATTKDMRWRVNTEPPQRSVFAKNLIRRPFKTLAEHWAQSFYFGNMPKERAEAIIENALRIRYLFCLDISDEQLKKHLQRTFIIKQERPWKRTFVLKALLLAFSNTARLTLLWQTAMAIGSMTVLVVGLGAIYIYGHWLLKLPFTITAIFAGILIVNHFIDAVKKKRAQPESRPGVVTLPADAPVYGKHHKEYGITEFDHRYFDNDPDMLSWHELVHGMLKINMKRDMFHPSDFLAKEYYYVMHYMTAQSAPLFQSRKDIAGKTWTAADIEKQHKRDEARNAVGIEAEEDAGELYDEPEEIVYAIQKTWLENPFDMVFFLSLQHFPFKHVEDWVAFARDLRRMAAERPYDSIGDLFNRSQAMHERYVDLMHYTKICTRELFPVVEGYITRKLEQILTDLPRLETIETFRPEAQQTLTREVAAWEKKLEPWWKMKNLGWKVIVETDTDYYRAA